MEMKACICPQCGGPLDVAPGATETVCPSCGSKIHISYSGQQDPGTFATAEGLPVATARIPQGFTTQASLSRTWQSEMVPFVTTVVAKSGDGAIALAATSREMFHDVKSAALKSLLGMLQNHTAAGYQPYQEPEAYVRTWAEALSGLQLTPTATAPLPSPLGQDPALARQQLQQEIELYNSFWGEAFTPVNVLCQSTLYRFTGTANGQTVVALAGVDFHAAELTGGLPFGLAEMTGGIPGLKDLFGGQGGADLKSAVDTALHGDGAGIGGMTMGDWMRGGLLGKMMRDRKAKQQAAPQSPPQPEKAPESAAFGQGKHLSMVSYGSHRRYLCLCPQSREEEATGYFLRFLSTLRTDPALARQEQQQLQQKLALLQQEAARNTAMAQQMQMRTQQMQMETSRMIARNSEQISAGIMDSWNRRMDAQSRMSANYSEAVRGVNSYAVPTGGTVEMNVAADHVYQNRYGDTIGVSGNAVDPETAARLDWTELERK